MNPVFRYRHWAGFSQHTHRFRLALTCVFIKQTELPCQCHQPLPRLAPLLPRVQGDFAEFPREDYIQHALGFSPRGTCVGSRYGHAGGSGALFTGTRNRPLEMHLQSRLRHLLAITALQRLLRSRRTTVLLGISRCVGRRTITAWCRNIKPASLSSSSIKGALRTD